MAYREEMANITTTHRKEIESDLDVAREELRRLQTAEEKARQTVERYESLLSFGEFPELPIPESPSTLTLHDAMRAVLSEAPLRKLRAGDIARRINGRKLYSMRDGRPVEPQQIHARVGHYKHLFSREGTLIALNEGPISKGKE